MKFRLCEKLGSSTSTKWLRVKMKINPRLRPLNNSDLTNFWTLLTMQQSVGIHWCYVKKNTSRPVMFAAAITLEMELYNSEPRSCPVPRSEMVDSWCRSVQDASCHGPCASVCYGYTQTKSERLKSTSGYILEDRRSKLLTLHVTELTFLRENL